jgi:serine acetyltransferase
MKVLIIGSSGFIGLHAVAYFKIMDMKLGAIVVACAVVTKDVPLFTVVAGNPAVVVKQLK